MVKPPCSNFWVITANCLGLQIFRSFTVSKGRLLTVSFAFEDLVEPIEFLSNLSEYILKLYCHEYCKTLENLDARKD